MSERKPLTLEELRDMAGKPVWIERNDPPHDGKWDLVDYADTEHLDKTLYTKSGVTYSEYGKYFTAYAYEPHHLDCSAWDPCEHCKTCDTCKHQFGGMYCGKNGWGCKNGSNHIPKANFCSICGRPLTDAAWEMLEKRLEGNK